MVCQYDTQYCRTLKFQLELIQFKLQHLCIRLSEDDLNIIIKYRSINTTTWSKQ